MPLWYKTWGDSNHPPLIFFHGFMGTHDDFFSIIQDLSSQFYCIALDLPGHGHSANLSYNSLDAFEKDLLDFVSAYPNSLWIGYSLGGRICSSYYPKGNAKGLVLISSALKALEKNDERELQIKTKEWKDHLEQNDFTIFLEKWFSQPLFKTLKANPSLYDLILKKRLAQDPKKIAFALEFFSPLQLKIDPQFLEKLNIPLLYLSGKEDLKYFNQAEEAHKKKPSIWSAYFSHASHALIHEEPANIAWLIKQFYR